MNKFIKLIAEILEVDAEDISMDTNFRIDIEGWDSMKGFSTICMIEDEYGIQIDVLTFLKCKTIGDLYNKAIAGKWDR